MDDIKVWRGAAASAEAQINKYPNWYMVNEWRQYPDGTIVAGWIVTQPDMDPCWVWKVVHGPRLG